MSDWKATRRGATVAFLPFLVFLITTHNFLLAVILSVPFLVLGARIERDGDWSSPRRAMTLFVVSVLTIAAAAATGGLIALGFVAAPVVGIVVWIAAGPGTEPSNPSVVVRVRRRP